MRVKIRREFYGLPRIHHHGLIVGRWHVYTADFIKHKNYKVLYFQLLLAKFILAKYFFGFVAVICAQISCSTTTAGRNKLQLLRRAQSPRSGAHPP
jgi:hypothetical protein